MSARSIARPAAIAAGKRLQRFVERMRTRALAPVQHLEGPVAPVARPCAPTGCEVCGDSSVAIENGDNICCSAVRRTPPELPFMTRSTLKLPPRSGPAGPAKPPTSRARRAQHGRMRRSRCRQGNTSRRSRVGQCAAAGKEHRRTCSETPGSQCRGRAHPPRGIRSAARRRRIRTASRIRGTARGGNPRLSKRMSELGLCSRREADEWIENGWVSVDGVVTTALGTRVRPTPGSRSTPPRAGTRASRSRSCSTSRSATSRARRKTATSRRACCCDRKTVGRGPHADTFRPGHLRGLAPAGRLDIDSTGLIVFTQDGRVARRLIGRDSEVEKEYLVRVEGTLSPEGMQRLQHGSSSTA